ncbi:MAG: monovalent cation/H+ antiporter complex subunit F [Acidobacteriota bacterium]|nr:monovalent cation/H+ antiporter complex subunit F [Acidobacteriota bacterium]
MLELLAGAQFAAMIVLLIAAFITFIRLAKGPKLADRVAALDLLAVIFIGMMLLHTISTGEQVYLDAVMVLAMISFIGTIGFARYIIHERERS